MIFIAKCNGLPGSKESHALVGVQWLIRHAISLVLGERLVLGRKLELLKVKG